MTAKEMFKELGYELVADNYCFIDYWKQVKNNVYISIRFGILGEIRYSKIYDFHIFNWQRYIHLKVKTPLIIDEALLKAITKQIEELS